MTEVQKQLADEIISFFKKREGVAVPIEEIYKLQNAEKEFTLERIRYVTAMLVNKGLLHATPYVFINTLTTLHPNYTLTDKGWTYVNYDKVLEEESKQKKLEILQIKSAIRTNKSVRKTNNIQIGVLILTAILSTFSLVFSYLDYKKESITNVAAPKVRVQLPPRVLDRDTLMKNTLDTLQ